MSPPALISRSLSLPSSQEDIRGPSLTYPTRQPSQMVCLDTPLTPPMSPKLNKDVFIEDQHDQTESESKEIDQLQNVQDVPQDVPQPMETDDVVPLHRPQRLLEDEKVHLQRSGIKLSDFEVRGTLGMHGLSNFFALLAYFLFFRDRNLRESAPRSPPKHSCTVNCTNTKPFRDESPSKN